MDPSAALIAGLAAGLAIAMQVGAVSLLLVETAVTDGPRVGVAAGMGVAAADLGFAVIAAAAGGAAGAALASHETELRLIAATVIAAIAVHGLMAIARDRNGAAAARSTGGAAPERDEPWAADASHAASEATPRAADGSHAANEATPRAADGSHAASEYTPRGSVSSPVPSVCARAHFARFLAITAANPLTIASFAAVAAALSLDGPAAAAAFAAGVGVASAAWHLLLSLAAGHAGRWVTPRVRRRLAIAGRLAVIVIAAHLAFG
jgi:threonine/homoserine/homoserine lactone efflux protein